MKPKLKKNERIVVFVKGDGYYIGAVSIVRKKINSYRVTLDNGDVLDIKFGSKFVIGKGIKKTRKTAIPEHLLGKWVAEYFRKPAGSGKSTSKKGDKKFDKAAFEGLVQAFDGKPSIANLKKVLEGLKQLTKKQQKAYRVNKKKYFIVGTFKKKMNLKKTAAMLLKKTLKAAKASQVEGVNNLIYEVTVPNKAFILDTGKVLKKPEVLVNGKLCKFKPVMKRLLVQDDDFEIGLAPKWSKIKNKKEIENVKVSDGLLKAVKDLKSRAKNLDTFTKKQTTEFMKEYRKLRNAATKNSNNRAIKILEGIDVADGGKPETTRVKGTAIVKEFRELFPKAKATFAVLNSNAEYISNVPADDVLSVKYMPKAKKIIFMIGKAKMTVAHLKGNKFQVTVLNKFMKNAVPFKKDQNVTDKKFASVLDDLISALKLDDDAEEIADDLDDEGSMSDGVADVVAMLKERGVSESFIEKYLDDPDELENALDLISDDIEEFIGAYEDDLSEEEISDIRGEESDTDDTEDSIDWDNLEQYTVEEIDEMYPNVKDPDKKDLLREARRIRSAEDKGHKFVQDQIIYMEDVDDPTVRHEVQYRGKVDDEYSMVLFGSKQMRVETSRLFKHDIEDDETSYKEGEFVRLASAEDPTSKKTAIYIRPSKSEPGMSHVRVGSKELLVDNTRLSKGGKDSDAVYNIQRDIARELKKSGKRVASAVLSNMESMTVINEPGKLNISYVDKELTLTFESETVRLLHSKGSWVVDEMTEDFENLTGRSDGDSITDVQTADIVTTLSAHVESLSYIDESEDAPDGMFDDEDEFDDIDDIDDDIDDEFEDEDEDIDDTSDSEEDGLEDEDEPDEDFDDIDDDEFEDFSDDDDFEGFEDDIFDEGDLVDEGDLIDDIDEEGTGEEVDDDVPMGPPKKQTKKEEKAIKKLLDDMSEELGEAALIDTLRSASKAMTLSEDDRGLFIEYDSDKGTLHLAVDDNNQIKAKYVESGGKGEWKVNFAYGIGVDKIRNIDGRTITAHRFRAIIEKMVDRGKLEAGLIDDTTDTGQIKLLKSILKTLGTMGKLNKEADTIIIGGTPILTVKKALINGGWKTEPGSVIRRVGRNGEEIQMVMYRGENNIYLIEENASTMIKPLKEIKAYFEAIANMDKLYDL